MAKVTRGFVGRRRPQQPGRLPPGQYDVGRDGPVLTAEFTPRVDPHDFMDGVLRAGETANRQTLGGRG